MKHWHGAAHGQWCWAWDELRCRPLRRSRTAGSVAVGLDGRTGDVAVGTEDAAVAGLGLEHGAAPLAVVEVLTGVRRHGLRLPMSTLRTGQDGGGLDVDDAPPPALRRSLNIQGSINGPQASATSTRTVD